MRSMRNIGESTETAQEDGMVTGKELAMQNAPTISEVVEWKDREIAVLTKRNRKLIEALEVYGHHKADCSLSPCDCGILEILAGYRA